MRSSRWGISISRSGDFQLASPKTRTTNITWISGVENVTSTSFQVILDEYTSGTTPTAKFVATINTTAMTSQPSYYPEPSTTYALPVTCGGTSETANFGTSLVNSGGNTYIYGVANNGFTGCAYVARVSGTDLTQPWNYYNGSSWQASNTPIDIDSPNDVAGHEFSVVEVSNDLYRMVSSQGQQGNIFISTSSTPYGPFNEVLLKPPVPSQLFPGGYNYPEDVNQSLYSYPLSLIDSDSDGDPRKNTDCTLDGSDVDNDGDCYLTSTDSPANDNDVPTDSCVLFGYNVKEQPDLETNGDIVIMRCISFDGDSQYVQG